MKEKIGKKYYSEHFKQWIEVVQYLDDNHWTFKLENGEVYTAQTPLSYFEGHDFTRDNPKRAVKQDMSKGQFVDCTDKTNDKIEEIINKYQIHTSIGIKETIDVCDEWDMKTMGVAINEISTLIQEEREEAIRGFAEYVEDVKNKGRVSSWVEEYFYLKRVSRSL